jgi:hypothetical protein
MPDCNLVTEILETECIGDSLSKINTNFANLETEACASQTLVAGKVNKAGDNITGQLTVQTYPTEPKHVTTKDYVDAGLGEKLSTSGGTMTGDLFLFENPTPSPGVAVSKQHLEDRLTQIAILSGSAGSVLAGPGLVGGGAIGTMPTISLGTPGTLGISTTNSTTSNSHTHQLNFIELDGRYLMRSGTPVLGMTGHLLLFEDPILELHAAPKRYVDNTITQSISSFDHQSFAKAWVTFDGDPTVPIVGSSYNVESVVRTPGTAGQEGRYQINFTEPMPTASFAIVGTSTNSSPTGGWMVVVDGATPTPRSVTYARISTINPTSGLTKNSSNINVTIF